MYLWVFENQIYTKIILLWQIPNVLPKGSCYRALVLKPRLQCLIETVVSIKHLGLYAPLRIPSKRNACKAMLHMACG